MLIQRKRKLVKRLQLKMAHPGDKFTDPDQLFTADTLKNITDEVTLHLFFFFYFPLIHFLPSLLVSLSSSHLCVGPSGNRGCKVSGGTSILLLDPPFFYFSPITISLMARRNFQMKNFKTRSIGVMTVKMTVMMR